MKHSIKLRLGVNIMIVYDKGQPGPELGHLPGLWRAPEPAVRGRVGPHQHRQRHLVADAARGRVGRGDAVRQAAQLGQLECVRAGRVGAWQHRGRWRRAQRLGHQVRHCGAFAGARQE